MSKGERTREMIVASAAALFNTKGYGRVSMSDIMRETGLEKGGIYNHFPSKEDLALQAFDYMIAALAAAYGSAVAGKASSIDRLHAIIRTFDSLVENPVVAGGCPLLNAAVESDDADPRLRERTKQAMDDWFRLLTATIQRGVRRGEVRPGVSVEEAASVIIGSLEGAMMLTKLYGDRAHMKRAISFLNRYIGLELAAGAGPGPPL